MTEKSGKTRKRIIAHLKKRPFLSLGEIKQILSGEGIEITRPGILYHIHELANKGHKDAKNWIKVRRTILKKLGKTKQAILIYIKEYPFSSESDVKKALEDKDIKIVRRGISKHIHQLADKGYTEAKVWVKNRRRTKSLILYYLTIRPFLSLTKIQQKLSIIGINISKQAISKDIHELAEKGYWDARAWIKKRGKPKAMEGAKPSGGWCEELTEILITKPKEPKAFRKVLKKWMEEDSSVGLLEVVSIIYEWYRKVVLREPSVEFLHAKVEQLLGKRVSYKKIDNIAKELKRR